MLCKCELQPVCCGGSGGHIAFGKSVAPPDLRVWEQDPWLQNLQAEPRAGPCRLGILGKCSCGVTGSLEGA